MRKPIFFTLLACILQFFAGCGFLFPLYTVKDIYTDKNLEGTWTRLIDTTEEAVTADYPKDDFEVAPLAGGKYMVIQQNGPSLFVFHYLTFVKIKDRLFVDEQMSRNGDTSQLTADHNFGKAFINGDTIIIDLLNDDYIEQQVKNGKLKLKYSYSPSVNMSDGMGSGPSLMIQEPTEKLQQLMLSLYNDQKAFLGEMYFAKKKN